MQLKQVFHSLAVVSITILVFIPVVFQAAALLAVTRKS
ncbi:small toxic polypeptide [Serratia liquefaciens]|uniref:Small toxic polypeptide n=1 Tax=Serratia liquefaciens TaxID=614 RepID=A0A515CSK7_SERLI|nr:small toxic polypeptide [Serratia liquefaciens]